MTTHTCTSRNVTLPSSSCSSISFPTHSQVSFILECPGDLLNNSLDSDILDCVCFRDIVDVPQDSLRDSITRGYSSVLCVTHDFEEHCVFLRDSTDSLSSAIVEHDPAYAIFLHDSVYASGNFNYRVSHLPVPSKLNIPLWQSLLVDYDDFIVCDYLEFGWPVGYVC